MGWAEMRCVKNKGELSVEIENREPLGALPLAAF